jgi:hypothetical protein
VARLSVSTPSGASGGRRFGRLLEALLAALLAIGAALLLIDISDWKFVRVDLSASSHNTLDPELSAVLERLPDTARIDLFLRPLQAPFDRVHAEGVSLFLDELQRITGARRDVLEVVEYDLGDLELVLARQAELGVEGSNIIVVSSGDRRTTLRLYGDILAVDWGNPPADYARYLAGEGITGVMSSRSAMPGAGRAPQISSVRCAAALAEALLRVGSEDRPLAVFVQGHGESDPLAPGAQGLSRFKKMLGEEGFVTEPWTGQREGDLPEGADLVLLIGPRTSLAPEDLDALDEYVAGGGQLLVAVSSLEMERDMGRGAREVMKRHGMQVLPGIACVPLRTRGGGTQQGTESVVRFQVGENGLATSHPTTTPLRSENRPVEFIYTPAFKRIELQTVGGGQTRNLLPLVTAPQGAWLDLMKETDQGSGFDFVYEPGIETRSRLALIMSAEYAAGSGGGRVLGIGSSFFLEDDLYDSNHDFLRNAVNWLAHRETRLRIAPRNAFSSRLDLRESNALTILNYTLWFGLPLLCGLIALAVGLRRRLA